MNVMQGEIQILLTKQNGNLTVVTMLMIYKT